MSEKTPARGAWPLPLVLLAASAIGAVCGLAGKWVMVAPMM